MLGTLVVELTLLLGYSNLSTCSMNIGYMRKSRRCHGPVLRLHKQQWFVDINAMFPNSFSFISIPVIWQLCFRVNFSTIEWRGFIASLFIYSFIFSWGLRSFKWEKLKMPRWKTVPLETETSQDWGVCNYRRELHRRVT